MTTGKPEPPVGDIDRPYWQAARDGRLTLQRCRDCRVWLHPPGRWCRSCWGRSLEWVDAAGTGRVVTFTVVHQAPSAPFEDEVPYVLAIVRLDEGPQLMTNLLDVDGTAPAIGQRVRVVFEPRGHWAVPQFTPVDGD